MNHIRKEIRSSIRLKILKRDGYQCAYCGVNGKDAELEIDHIIPVSKGGSNKLANLITACRKCNAEKLDSVNFKSKKTYQQTEGLFFHEFDDEGLVMYQGRIIKENEFDIFAELYSWMHGFATGHIKVYKKQSFADNKKFIFYNDAETWVKAGDYFNKIAYQASIKKE
jgi:hypothetical protein